MEVKKPRIVIIGAGMAGLAAANKLYTSSGSKGLFELCVIEGGNRIGGRINTSEFGGDRIEMGATWIHGTEGSPVYKIAQESNSMDSDNPWECMDGFPDNPITIAENGFVLTPSLIDPISNLFMNLIDLAQGKKKTNGVGTGNTSFGSFLKKGLEDYWEVESRTESEGIIGNGNWNRKLLEEAVFAMQENNQRVYSAANDLFNLDYKAESEYVTCPGENVTIAKGYSSVVDSLASNLPYGVIQLGKKVCKIEWQPNNEVGIITEKSDQDRIRPVMLHFHDGTTLSADHVIVTVSLGVLKAGIRDPNGSAAILKFDPPLPDYKIEAISRLGYGVVNKLFLQLSPDFTELDQFPFLQFVFHQSDSEARNPKIPWWIRRTASISPIYKKSRVLLSWFAGDEALKLETLPDEVILDQVSTTLSTFLSNSSEECNGDVMKKLSKLNLVKVLKTRWGKDPLFLGSYSYVAVGSSTCDMDKLAEPLTKSGSYPLQILFAGEATHRTHFSTTHGAYFSGIREANRLLEHYHCMDS
ncbi:probable polyamine oxidase 5 [Rutidosis leptorrhynchoides]|uniref:probable polyamine oxidase 5 n=1 Tax=Rutidosis leptorrhynchoides TaxID=125765 RepID=UPI003A99AEEF